MSKEKKPTVKKVYIAVIVLTVLLALGAVAWTGIRAFDTSKQTPSIELSSTIGDKMYRGGSGEIRAILRYDDGRVEKGDFVYQSNHDALKFANNQSGLFTVESDETLFNNAISRQGDIATVTVASSANKNVNAKTITVKLTPAITHKVTFVYPNINSVGDTVSSEQDVYEGYAVDENKFSASDVGLSDDEYEIVWYVDGTNEVFNLKDNFIYRNDITVTAKASLKKDIVLVDELHDKKYLVPKGTVVYGETLPEDILNAMSDISDEEYGWTFAGWYPDVNSTDLKNGVDGDGNNFYAQSSTLYARWTSKIMFRHKVVEDDSAQSMGSPSVAEMQVVYGGNITSLPEMKYKIDSNKIAFKGWYYDTDYNEETKIEVDQQYKGTASQTYYDKTEVCLTFNDELNDKSTEVWTVYGKSLNQLGLPLPSITLKRGWNFENKWQVEGYGEATSDEIKTLQYKWSSPISLTAIWNVKIRYYADIGQIQNVYGVGIEYNENTVRYGQKLINSFPFPQGDNNVWQCDGWYDNEDYSGEAVARLSTSDNTFIEWYDAKCTNIGSSAYYLPLYAKWVANVNLDYKNNSSGEPSSELPSYIRVVYGKELTGLPARDEIAVPSTFDHGPGWYFEANSYIVEYDDAAGLWKNKTVDYPLNMNKLYYKWNGQTYDITLKYANKDGNVLIDKNITVTRGEPMPSLDSSFRNWGANKPDGQFLGYFYNDVQYYNSQLEGSRDWDMPMLSDGKYELTALFGKTYTVTLYDGANNGGTGSVQACNGYALPSGAKAPTRTGYTFLGYYESATSSKQYYDKNMKPTDNVWTKGTGTVYPKWKANEYWINYNVNGGNILDPQGKKVTFNGTYGELPTPTKNNESKKGGYYSYKFEGWHLDSVNGAEIKNETSVTTAENHCLVAKWSSKWNECVAAGTLITLADGSQVPVEQLKGDELLLVWNLYTGKFDVAPILFVDSDPETVYEVINLYFSDGTTVKVISEHGFWDYDLNEWVYLRNDGAKYVGHWFNKQSVDANGNLVNVKVQLVDVAITNEITTTWSPVTFGHLCYYVNGALSMPGGVEGFINIFDVDPETMKVDEAKMAQDIEKYGLFTYDDFAEYIPEEVFNAFNGQYLKVAMGKGLITWQDIFALIDRYSVFWK